MTDGPLSKSSRLSLSTWLWNPFTLIAGWPALITGIALMCLTGFIASRTNTHFDGVLDTHVGFNAPFWVFPAESLINWLSLSLVLIPGGLIVSRDRKFRAIDLVGTQALARWPFLIVSFFTMLPGFTSFSHKLASIAMSGKIELPKTSGLEVGIFALVVLVMIAMTVWFVALAWKSFRVSCDARGGKAITTFIISIIVAEIISKFAIMKLYSACLTEASA